MREPELELGAPRGDLERIGSEGDHDWKGWVNYIHVRVFVKLFWKWENRERGHRKGGGWPIE
jgi:hypothetical protein